LQTYASRDTSSSYANSFNPPPLDEMGIPYQRLPVSRNYSSMIESCNNGTVTPSLIEKVMSEINDDDKTSIDSPTVT
jgi:hypothetical protein